MTVKSNCHDTLEQPQAYKRRRTRSPPTDQPEAGIMADNATADEDAQTQRKLKELNESTISDLEKIVNDDPTVDLWLSLREASRKYKTERANIVEPPAPIDAVPDETASSEVEKNRHIALPKHIYPPEEGDVSILWPLATSLAELLQISSASADTTKEERRAKSKEETSQRGEDKQITISRAALSDLLKRGEVLSQVLQRAVVRIAPDIVVKVCRGTDVTEAANLAHIHACTSQTDKIISVPETLGMIQIGKRSYLFTTFVPGVPLDRVWANLTLAKKEHIQQQLNSFFLELRSLPLPSKDGFLGSGDDPSSFHCQDRRRWLRTSAGPIVNEAQFNDFLLTEAHAHPTLVELIRSCLPENHLIVMTHGDLHPRNLIVNNEEDVRISGIIDWESGGGYPEYWEYVKAFHMALLSKDKDWHLFLPETGIGTFKEEYVRDRSIDRAVN
ncbi:hypothetical protein L228DRAFT_283534 [Xylona heveae TC161]|uniref:Aminoglycoside phosphotransferase domain-containing protein n=1 Tax=Xylona heveae (strain CBS 132557 / TC161) TaxID=1328760 RepID=A0A165GMT6_XYLHT|nr:hypothetical protein L228DRAFT_283534 [Xylona heveae TC161]KZF22383.1 hypothetical protein L228DRAFT_283534 [Xylona heveae TC161]